MIFSENFLSVEFFLEWKWALKPGTGKRGKQQWGKESEGAQSFALGTEMMF
jgi:hypothetical protein